MFCLLVRPVFLVWKFLPRKLEIVCLRWAKFSKKSRKHIIKHCKTWPFYNLNFKKISFMHCKMLWKRFFHGQISASLGWPVTISKKPAIILGKYSEKYAVLRFQTQDLWNNKKSGGMAMWSLSADFLSATWNYWEVDLTRNGGYQ